MTCFVMGSFVIGYSHGSSLRHACTIGPHARDAGHHDRRAGFLHSALAITTHNIALDEAGQGWSRFHGLAEFRKANSSGASRAMNTTESTGRSTPTRTKCIDTSQLLHCPAARAAAAAAARHQVGQVRGKGASQGVLCLGGHCCTSLGEQLCCVCVITRSGGRIGR